MMKFEGVVRDGVIVPDEPVTLKDGTRVLFEDVDEVAEPMQTFAEAFGDLRGCLSPDTPNDLASQHDHYRLGTPKR
jgi:hypothetical protein